MNLERLKAKAQKIATDLSSPPNLTMTFKSLTGTGGASTTYTFEAIAQPISQDGAYLYGSNIKEWKIKGRLVNPKTFPKAIKHQSKATATLDGKPGELTLYLPPQNPYLSKVEEGQRVNALGDRFEALFVS